MVSFKAPDSVNKQPIVLSSRIEDFRLESDAAEPQTVSVTLQEMGERPFWQTGIYVVDSTYISVRDIITCHMRQKNMTAGTFFLSLFVRDPENPGDMTHADEVMLSVLFDDVDEDFDPGLSFLTPFRNLSVPRYARNIPLSLWSEEPGAIRITAKYPDAPDRYTTLQIIDFEAGLTNFRISVPDLIEIADATFGIGQENQPSQIRVTAGFRELRIWVMPQDRMPSACLMYRNSFNCEEIFWSYGKWTEKSETTYDTAVCCGRARTFNRKVTQEITIETHRLDLFQAYAAARIADTGEPIQVMFATGIGWHTRDMITDKAELENSPTSDPAVLKLTMHPVNAERRTGIIESGSRFDNTFTPSFF